MVRYGSPHRWEISLHTVGLATIGLGITVRALFWIIYPPIWKLFAVFAPLDMSAIGYAQNFESYHPLRMPFFDLFSAAFYLPVSGILGVKGLSLFTLLISSVSVVAFYYGTRELFDGKTAVFGTMMFALYPKFVTMTVRGIPEAAMISAVGIMVYFLAKAQRSGHLRWFFAAGVAALFAYLMYMPAVFVGVLVTGYLYARGRAERDLSLLPRIRTSLFALPSFIVGSIYLVVGPITTALSAAGGSAIGFDRELFVGSYSVVEKVLRYVTYTFVDFWWHQRGFDAENHIFGRVHSISDFLGRAFVPAALVWLAATVFLSALVLTGFLRVARRRRPMDWLLLTWIGVYFLFYNARNAGWQGAFMTRHVAPVFPAIAILFGIGCAVAVDGLLADERLPGLARRVVSRFPDPEHAPVIIGCVVLSFSLLLVVGTIHGEFTASNADHLQSAVEELDESVADDAAVGVPEGPTFKNVVLYSEGNVRPIIVVPSERNRTASARYTTSVTEITVIPPERLSRADLDYFYVLSPCGDYTTTQRQYLADALDDGGEVILESSIEGGSRCDVNATLVSLSA